MTSTSIRLSLLICAISLFSNLGWGKPFPDCSLEDGVSVCRNAHSDPRETGASSFDLYLPGAPAQNQTFRPIVLIHGGCFNGGDKTDMASEARRFAKAGFAALSINYTLAQTHQSSYSDVLNDLRTHLHWLSSDQAKTLKIQTDWIGAFGESSGATLAAYLGTRHLNPDRPRTQASVDSVVDFYGRIDLTRPQPKGKGTDCAQIFLNADRDTDMSLFQDASVTPQTGIKPAGFLIIHGLDDQQVEPWHSRHLQQELRDVGVSIAESQLVELPGQGHGFTGAGLETALDDAGRFFQSEAARHNPGPTQIWFKKAGSPNQTP